MFSTSTQRKHWMYESPEELEELRKESNEKTGENLIKAGKVAQADQLLTPQEELYLVRSFLVILKDFCRKFTPPMRRSLIATAFIYLKRFYLNESCMDYHPKVIGVTCAYLACKVDEFNVSIDAFIKNVKGDREKAQQTVLSNELLLMKKLRFHLTVHLPHRAVEGFLIDLRARYRPARDKTDLLVPDIDDFLDKSMFTDACFLYTPSQIALAAICYSAEKCNLDLTPYLTDILFVNNQESLEYFQLASEGIRSLIEKDSQNVAGRDVLKKIEKKLNGWVRVNESS